MVRPPMAAMLHAPRALGLAAGRCSSWMRPATRPCCTASWGSDGRQPQAGLVLDTQGNLYGTTNDGGCLQRYGPIGCGTVYKLDTTGRETVLYSFPGKTCKFPPQV